jgi:His-Xaa-Ser system radical SAM maturase HxsC
MNNYLVAENVIIGKIADIQNDILLINGYNIENEKINISIPLSKTDNKHENVNLLYSIGDIILYSNNRITTLFYSNSKHNAFFITEKCNNNCLMCSQPPKNDEDTQSLFRINNLLVDLLPSDIEIIGITGGEPILFFDELIALLIRIINKLPDSVIHILTNGRLFNDFERVNQLASINNGNIVIGVPIHSDVFFEHDFISQAKGSFYQTMKGLYNLASNNIHVEIRIVINKQNYNRLNSITDFIYKNLPFVDHVAFMSLEYIGNAVTNYDIIDCSPLDYYEDLAISVSKLKRWGLNASIYNIPLCMLKPTIFEFAKKSISDWKLKFLPECEKCILKNECCGLFATSKVIHKVIPFV